MNEDQEMQSVTKQGLPVRERVATIEAARSIAAKLDEDDSVNAILRTRIKGHLNGNAPYDQNKLDDLGLGDMVNSNYLEMLSMLNRKASSNFELFFETPTLLTLTPIKYDPTGILAHHGGVQSEEVSRLLKDWTGFGPAMDRARREADSYGIGGCYFEDETDWRFKAFNRGSFRFDQFAETDPETLEVFSCQSNLSIHKLFEYALRDPEASKLAGWDIKVVKDTLVAAFRNNGQSVNNVYATTTWESLEQGYRNNDSSVQVQEFRRLQVRHMWVKEADTGEVSHYIFTEDAPVLGQNSQAVTDGFLYRKTRRYPSVQNTLWLLPYDGGDGLLKSIRGLASQVEVFCDLSNRFLSRVIDAGFLSGSIMLQPETESDVSRMQLVRMGYVTMLPAGVKVMQASTFAPPLGNMVQLRDLMINVMRNNTGVWREHPELMAEQQVYKSATQAQIENARESRLENLQIAHDYAMLRLLYREVFRRLSNKAYYDSSVDLPGLKEARLYVDRCRQRQVPDELIFGGLDVWQLEVYQTMGMGSVAVRMQMADKLLGLMPTMDEVGRRLALRDAGAVFFGYRNVDRYWPQKNRDQVPSNETTIATLENNDMADGVGVPVGSDQMHGTHAMTHAAPLVELLQLAAQGVEQLDAMRALRFLSAMLPHFEQTLQYLSGDPSRQDLVKQLVDVFKQAQGLAQKLQVVVQRQQEQQAQLQAQQQQMLQQAVSGEAQMKLQIEREKVMGELQNDAVKQQSMHDMRIQKMDAQLEARRRAQDEDLANKRHQMEEDLRIKYERMVRELEIKARSGGPNK